MSAYVFELGEGRRIRRRTAFYETPHGHDEARPKRLASHPAIEAGSARCE